MIPPNQSPRNDVYIVRLRRNPARAWHVLASSEEEAIACVVAGEPRTAFADYTASLEE